MCFIVKCPTNLIVFKMKSAQRYVKLDVAFSSYIYIVELLKKKKTNKL